MALAIQNWSELNGTMLLNTGRSLHEFHLPELLDIVYAWAVRDISAEKKAEFDQKLTMPEPGAEVAEDDSEWSDEMLFRQFMQTQQQVSRQAE